MLNDDLLDAVEILWETHPPSLRARIPTATTTEETVGLRVVDDYLSRSTWSDLPLILRCLGRRNGLDVNGSGFDFEGETVNLYDPLDDVDIETGAFLRLMHRYLSTLRSGALAEREILLEAAWWPDLVDALDNDRIRVGPSLEIPDDEPSAAKES